MLKAGPAACWLWVCGLAHCQSQLTDGFVSDQVLPMIGIPGGPRTQRLADTLVKAGLFDRVQGGYQIHDYLAFNETRAEAMARKDTGREQRRLAGISSGRSRRVERTVNEPVDGSLNPGSLNPIPSHPIQASPNQKRQQPPNARSKRPIYQSDRFVVFDWQLEGLAMMLGPHVDDFDLHGFFDELSQQSRASGLVIPADRDARWVWLQAQVEAEARRRGLPMATVDPPKKRIHTTTLEQDTEGVREVLKRQGAL